MPLLQINPHLGITLPPSFACENSTCPSRPRSGFFSCKHYWHFGPDCRLFSTIPTQWLLIAATMFPTPPNCDNPKLFFYHQLSVGFSGVAVIKNLLASAGDERDEGSVSGLERSPGGGNGNLLQYSCLEIFHGQRSLVGCSLCGHHWAAEHMSIALGDRISPSWEQLALD